MNGYFCVINGTVSFKHPLQSIHDFAKVVWQINGFSTAVFQSPLLKKTIQNCHLNITAEKI